MADNKKNIGNPDRYLISFKQKWEFDYAAKQVQNKGPKGTTKQEAKDGLSDAARNVAICP